MRTRVTTRVITVYPQIELGQLHKKKLHAAQEHLASRPGLQ